MLMGSVTLNLLIIENHFSIENLQVTLMSLRIKNFYENPEVISAAFCKCLMINFKK